MNRREFIRNSWFLVLWLGSWCSKGADIVSAFWAPEYTIDDAALLYPKDLLTAWGIWAITKVAMKTSNTFAFLMDIDLEKCLRMHHDHLIKTQSIQQWAEVQDVVLTCDIIMNHPSTQWEKKILLPQSQLNYPTPTGNKVSNTWIYHDNHSFNSSTFLENKFMPEKNNAYGFVETPETIICNGEFAKIQHILIDPSLYDKQLKGIQCDFVVNDFAGIQERRENLDRIVDENNSNIHAAFLWVRVQVNYGTRTTLEPVTIYMPISLTKNNWMFVVNTL